MDKIEKAQALRDIKNPHCNCAQAVLIPFAEECALSGEAAFRLAANFGSGMWHGATCGAVTGGLMALGLKGKGEAETRRFLNAFQEKNTYLACGELLEKMQADGLERKPYCDGKVRDAVEILEEILKD